MTVHIDSSAFPIIDGDGYFEEHRMGLTKREYFAAAALQGMLSNPEVYRDWESGSFAEKAVFHADKLIKELNATE